MDNKKEKKQQTPIIDGDARPDKNLPHQVVDNKKKRSREKFTPGRSGDINSLEDFKDSR
ncbi:MAG: hypothetical protein ACOYXT_13455 [Bacteroidota bacterium]